jgi:Zn-dependent peptidase ImmA (M78 family)
MTIINPFEIINQYREKAPVDVKAILKKLGIKVHEVDLGKSISGAIEKSRGGVYTISVNSADSLTRKRFTMAHELGHYMLHRDKIGDGITDNRMYRANEANCRIGSKEETQANQFAANLLMPKELIESLQVQGIKDEGELAEILSVSLQALNIRLTTL